MSLCLGRLLFWPLGLAAAGLVAGCTQNRFGDSSSGLPAASVDGPGSKVWASENVTCQADSECAAAAGEACIDGICQMRRCSEQYSSMPPMGQHKVIALYRELVLAEASGAIAAYEPSQSTLSHSGAHEWQAPNGDVVDVAGGSFFGTRPEVTATAHKGMNSVQVLASDGSVHQVAIGFEPIAIAAGDVDADGIDELVAVAADGRGAACSVVSGRCTTFSAGGNAKDITAADVDGDGFDEPVVLITGASGDELVVINLDAEKTNQKTVLHGKVPDTLSRISAGDLDGSGVAQVVALEPGQTSWDNKLANDLIHTYALDSEGQASQLTMTYASGGYSFTDVAVAMVEGEPLGRVAVLLGSTYTTGAQVSLYASRAQDMVLSELYRAPLASTSNPRFIASSDITGDSPALRMKDGPLLVGGDIVPIAALGYPPYSRTYSDGTSSVMLGVAQGQAKTSITTLSRTFGWSVEIGGGLKIPNIIEISSDAARSIGRTSSRWKGHVSVRSVSQTVIGSANPELEGASGGVIVLSSSCFHAYDYAIEDPAGKMGADGLDAVLVVPLGGETTVWSTRRYNAMANALNTLPQIDFPFSVGQPGTYPDHVMTIGGGPVPDDDMLFPRPPTYHVSDSTRTGFGLGASEVEINGAASTATVSYSSGIRAGLGPWGLKFAAHVDAGMTQSNDIAVNHDTNFGGSAPAIRSNPNTPEDEFGLHGYSFTPFVYREHYTDGNGNPAGFYVLTYSVSN